MVKAGSGELGCVAGRGFRRAAVVGWTGRGSMEDLRVSLGGVLGSAGLRGKVAAKGRALIVEGPDPSLVASALGNTPGVEWLAAGVASESLGEVGEASKELARRYMRPGSRFSVVSSGGEGVAASDISGVVVSAVVEEVRGVRVDEVKPQVVLRATLARSGGAVGVQVSKGPGGVPTGSRKVTCLVSGGMHSSVLCWMALLAGYRVTMVHAKVNEESLRAVARLYGELSRRVDPASVALEVLVGKDPGKIVTWVGRGKGPPVFAGSHAGCSNTNWPSARITAPLYLAQEEWFRSQISSLTLKPHESAPVSASGSAPPVETLVFGGVRADVSGVLDGLRARTESER